MRRKKKIYNYVLLTIYLKRGILYILSKYKFSLANLKQSVTLNKIMFYIEYIDMHRLIQNYLK